MSVHCIQQKAQQPYLLSRRMKILAFFFITFAVIEFRGVQTLPYPQTGSAWLMVVPVEPPLSHQIYQSHPNTHEDHEENHSIGNWQNLWSSSFARNPQTERKFFWFDNEANTVHSLPYPLVSPLGINNQMIASLTRPAFIRRTVSKVLTITSTVMTPVVSICVPSVLFINSTSPSSCIRRRRQFDELSDIYPSSVLPPITHTELNSPISDAEYRIDSSIAEEDSENRPLTSLRQPKKFRQIVTETSTVTVYAFLPTVIKKTIYPINIPKAGEGLMCIPPGITVC